MTPEFQPALPVDRIHEGAHNPRKHFDAEKMKELVESIRQKGVLQPILVRPLKVAGSAKASKDWEIVFGHRRLRAAKEAGLEVIPATVRELTDQEVVEAALLENAQRDDVHPLEQAEALRQLHDRHGLSTEELAVKMGKSKRWVQTQLQLCNLTAKAQEVFLAGKLLSASVALLVARIPNAKLQEEALKKVSAPLWHGGSMSYRESSDLIQRQYMLQLKDAPFDPQNPDLCPDVGACVSCPKRTGAQPDLFADVSSKDVCTDPPCYQRKVAAHGDGLIAKALSDGREVLDGKAAKKVWEHAYSRPNGYVKLSETSYDDPKNRTYKQLLKKASADVVVAVNPHTNRVEELVPERKLKELLKANGHDFKRSSASNGSTETWREQQKKEKAADAKRQAVLQRVVAKMVASVEEPETLTHKGFWEVIAEALAVTADDRVLDRRQLSEQGLRLSIKKLSAHQLRGLVFELAIQPWLGTYRRGYSKEVRDLARSFEIEIDQVAKELTAEQKAAAKGKASRAAPKGARCRSCEEPILGGGSGLCYRCSQVESRAARKAAAP